MDASADRGGRCQSARDGRGHPRRYRDARKDVAVRDLSAGNSTNWSPAFVAKLTPREGRARHRFRCASATSTISNSRRLQVRNSRRSRKRRCATSEVETPAGRRARATKHIPGEPRSAATCRAGVSHGSVAHAHVDRHSARRRVSNTSSPARRRFQGRTAVLRSWRRCISAAPTRFSCSAACRRSPAMALGTETIARHMIVGPGNAYVAEVESAQLFEPARRHRSSCRPDRDLNHMPTIRSTAKSARTDLLRPGRARPDGRPHRHHRIRKSWRAIP